MVGEKKKEEDIVGRLEALRKKVPPPTIEKAKSPEKQAGTPPPDEKRRKIARIIGFFVIIIIFAGVFYGGYTLFLKSSGPGTTPKPTGVSTNGNQDVVEQARLAELAKTKAETIVLIKDSYKGLPSEYDSERNGLIEEVNKATTKNVVEFINYETEATAAWRNTREIEVETLDATTGVVIAQVGEKLIKGGGDIKTNIELMSISELKTMIVREGRSEFLPIRLPREQAAGGFAEVGDRVNIHYTWEDANGTQVKYLAKDGLVVAILKPATTISLSESEQQTQTGGGTEGKGNVTTITLGSSTIAISDGPYGASVGYQQLSKSNTYTVDLAEVQKAAAASKISEEDFMTNMEKYGARLTQIERDTNIADFSSEYLMLLEVSEDEAREIVPTLLDADEKAKILITFSNLPSWVS